MKLQLSLVLSFLFCISASFSQTCIPAGMATPGQECTYGTAGSYTYTIPVGVEAIKIEAWGGGASGGFDSGDSKARSGGGGGGYVTNIYEVSAGQTISITVGAGGVITGATTSPGENGSSSSYNWNSSGAVVANGGSITNANSGGAGGSISGSFGAGSTPGGNGADRENPNTKGGGGGGSGILASSAFEQNGGTPGGGNGANENANGGDGTTPGGGGGGKGNNGSQSGDGGDGQVKITILDPIEYCSPAGNPVLGQVCTFTPGTYTYTIPQNVVEIKIQAWAVVPAADSMVVPKP